MTLLGRRIPFSGGGYMRLFPQALIHRGFRENHAQGRPGMSYIHPREINPDQPRLERPPVLNVKERFKYLKYYINLGTTRRKLAEMLRTFRFGTVRDVLADRTFSGRFRLDDETLTPC
jgi:hypothetical protein